VSHPYDEIETLLVDLKEFSVPQIEDCDAREFDSSVRMILQQVDRPRKNAGTGPPGRVD
jgi:hypothetical protein